ncbi:MAG: class I SAM-dependent methyltransferase [Burkholderiaceae bacterium]
MNESTSRPAAGPAGPPPDVPHEVLGEFYDDESRRREFLDQIFDKTAHSYDWTERLIGFGSGSWYRRQALLRAGLAQGMAVVDVGIGTGLVAREAIAVIGRADLLTGVDPSPGMMAQAQLPPGVRLLEGKGEDMPLDDASADFLSMGFALRHVSSLSEAFAEFHRVMKPGARLCLLEITPPANAVHRAVLRFYMTRIVPTLAWLRTRDAQTYRIWLYYWKTIEACVAPAVVMSLLRDAGFVDVHRHVELGMFSEYQARKAD